MRWPLVIADRLNRYFFAMMVAAITACVPLISHSQTADGLIVRPGRYSSPSGAAELVIYLESETRVNYRIVDTANQDEFRPTMHFSHSMRWAAFWQDDDTLWVHSSDIGLSVWKRDSQDRFAQEWLYQASPLVPDIPTELWDYLPSVLRRQWETQRTGIVVAQ